MKELSKKGKSICPSTTLVIDAKAKKMKADGINVVGFAAGEPDFDTPEFIRNAAIKAINEGFTRYTPASGILELKNAICKKLMKDNALDYNANQIVVSNGAKHSLVNVFKAICNPGDEVIIPVPFWVSYPEMVKIADGVPVFLETTEESGFKFSINDLEKTITSKTKAIIITSPSNPTGAVYTKEELQGIADICVKYDLFVISDEIYEKLIYNGEKHTSIASLGEEIKDLTIVVNGVSKSYAMTGWRIGYTASNAKITEIMSNIQSHETSNPNSIAQKAALAAIEGPEDEVIKMTEQFKIRKEYLVKRINGIKDLSCMNPDGAFYVMMNVSKYYNREIDGKKINNCDDFANVLLEKANVAVVPGSGFGANSHVRLSYATSFDNIKEGMDRIEKFLK